MLGRLHLRATRQPGAGSNMDFVRLMGDAILAYFGFFFVVVLYVAEECVDQE